MPDLTEDELHDSFARFRAEFQEELRPPGTQAIRRRVARRRRVRTAATTCGVILTLLGGFAAYSHHDGHSATSLDALVALDEALRLVGVAPDSPEMARPGVWYGTIHGAPTGHTFGYEYPAYPGGGGLYPAGAYALNYACVGPGVVTITYHYSPPFNGPGGSDNGKIEGRCGGLNVVNLYLSTPNVIDVSVTGDADAVAAGTQFAIAFTDPRTVAAQAALPPDPPGEFVAASTGDTYVQRLDTTVATAPGTYDLALVCVGSGTVNVTLGLGSARDTGPVTCEGGGGHVNLEVTGAAPADLSLLIGGSADAGYAYRIVRLS